MFFQNFTDLVSESSFYLFYSDYEKKVIWNEGEKFKYFKFQHLVINISYFQIAKLLFGLLILGLYSSHLLLVCKMRDVSNKATVLLDSSGASSSIAWDSYKIKLQCVQRMTRIRWHEKEWPRQRRNPATEAQKLSNPVDHM